MHKKFEEFVLEKTGRDDVGEAVENYCPSYVGLKNPGCDCSRCWAEAEGQWLSVQGEVCDG
jgi:hypothetical protein